MHLTRVLIIDDEIDYLDLLSKILRKRGFDVHALSAGDDALAITRSFKPDVILLDVRLGEMDGRLLCWQIKTTKDTHTVPVILHSAYGEIETEYKSYCADEFILKPMEVDYIIARMNAHLPRK